MLINRKYSLMLLHIVLGFILAGCNSGIGGSADNNSHTSVKYTKLRDNKLKLYPGSEVEKISITYNGEMGLPSNQPYKSISVPDEEDDNFGTYKLLTFKAGRHNEKWIGRDFINKSNIYITTTDDKLEEQSNFYFGTKILINGQPIRGDVYFAQYKSGSRNGWSIGNQYAKKGPDVWSFTLFTDDVDGREIPYCFFHNKGQSIEEFEVLGGDCNEVYDRGNGRGKIRDNNVSLSAFDRKGNSIPAVFEYQGQKVTENQPSVKKLDSLIVDDGGKKTLMINFMAGRHNSKAVADSLFENVEHDAVHLFKTGGRDDHPSKLNFYISGSLVIDGSPVEAPVFLGQGHISFDPIVSFIEIPLTSIGLLVDASVATACVIGAVSVGGIEGSGFAFFCVNAGLSIGGALGTGLYSEFKKIITNNWWIGSNAIANDNKDRIITTKNGRRYKISNKDDNGKAYINKFFFREL